MVLIIRFHQPVQHRRIALQLAPTLSQRQPRYCIAGGGEELHWTLSVLFDAMGAMSSKYNDTPELASRPYDVDRDGFAIAGGGGMVVLEDMDAEARGAKIYAELLAMVPTQMKIWLPLW